MMAETTTAATPSQKSSSKSKDEYLALNKAKQPSKVGLWVGQDQQDLWVLGVPVQMSTVLVRAAIKPYKIPDHTHTSISSSS